MYPGGGAAGIVTDETGLHAEECNCATCELGLRPTELERAAARRALAKRLAAEQKRKQEEAAKLAKASGVADVKRGARIMAEPPRPVVMPTPEEREELARLRREMFRR